MSDLTKLSLEAALAGLKAKDFSAVEITKAHIDACMDAADLNAFVTTDFQGAMKSAAVSDAKLAKGEGGALEGAPLGIKDLFCTEGLENHGGQQNPWRF